MSDLVFEYLAGKNIQKGELAGINSSLGLVVPADKNDIRIGYALRDILAGETVSVCFTGNTSDFATRGDPPV